MSKVEHRMSNLEIKSKKGTSMPKKGKKYVLSTIVFRIFKFKIQDSKSQQTMAAFGNFVRKVFDVNLNFRYQRVINPKIKDTFLMSILKVD